MNVDGLTKKEKEILFECLKAALHGPFFPDWEFSTLFGVERSTLADIEHNWPDVDFNNEKVHLSLHNSLVHLWGYPHGQEKIWDQYISVPNEEIYKLLNKIKITET